MLNRVAPFRSDRYHRQADRKYSWLFICLVVASLLTAACADRSDVGTAKSPDTLGPDTTMPMTALMIVRLTADPQTGCVGVVRETAPYDSAPQCSQDAILLPKGMRFLARPPRLVDGNGKVLARDGDVLHLGGGTGDDGRFIVSTIEKVIPSE